MKKNVLIMGYGEIGRAIDFLIDKKKSRVHKWDVDQSKVDKLQPLEELVARADYIFLCMHSWCLPQAFTAIKDHVRKKTKIVLLSKGIESKTNKLPFELSLDTLPNNKPILLFGPMLAEEIQQELVAGAMVAGASKKLCFDVVNLFKSGKLFSQYSTDLKSVSLVGVLKNEYSCFMGIVQAMNLGSNSFGIFSSQIIKEMEIIIQRLHGDPSLVISLAGMGDFLATAFSPYSSNRQTGMDLLKGKRNIFSESMQSLRPLLRLLDGNLQDLQLLKILAKIIIDQRKPQPLIKDFLNQ